MQEAKKSNRIPANETDSFAADVLSGLTSEPKTLPCKYFYDEAGSELFEQITRLPEYYPTRAEIEILSHHAGEVVGPERALIEFGSGSSTKTEILLRAMPSLRSYVPIDVSFSALREAASRIRAQFPTLNVQEIVGDFTDTLHLPSNISGGPCLGFFPGSTIGNRAPLDARRMLANFREMMPSGSRMLVGVDLKKDTRKLVLAYNDPTGVTAKFNVNILERINRELSASFDTAAFRHEALYNSTEGRMEMHLISTRHQTVDVLGTAISFESGETIHTENSYKYAIAEFQSLAQAAGWSADRVWADSEALFSVHELTT